jgi:hypothetical protein
MKARQTTAGDAMRRKRAGRFTRHASDPQKRLLDERAAAEGIITALTMEHQAMQHTLDEALDRIEDCAQVCAAAALASDGSCASASSSASSSPKKASPASTWPRSTPRSSIPRSARTSNESAKPSNPLSSANSSPPEDPTEKAGQTVPGQPQGHGTSGWIFALEMRNPAPTEGRGSNVGLLVGLAGFEPTTSSSRTKRAAKLRHSP